MTELRHALADAAAAVADGMASALGEDAAFADVALRLGWELSAPPPPLQVLVAPARAIVAAARGFADAPGSPAAWAQLGTAIAQLLAALDALPGASFGAELDALGFGSGFPGELLELVVYEHVRVGHPRLAAVARVLGIARTIRVPEQPGRLAHTRVVLAMPDLGAALRSPQTLWQEAWSWGTAALDVTALLDELVQLGRSFGAAAGYELSDVAGRLLGASPPVPGWTIVIDALSGEAAGAPYRVGLRIVPLADASGAIGLAVLPLADGGVDVPIDLSRDLVLALHGTGSAEGALALVVRPGGALDVLSGFDTGSPLPKPNASLALSLGRAGTAPEVVFGPVGGAAFAFQGWDLSVGAGARAGEPFDVWIELALRGAHLTIDGRAAPLAPAAPVDVPVALTLGMSRVRGVYVGTRGLAVTVPVGLALGPLHVDRIALAIAPAGSAVVASAAADLRLVIGPVAISAVGVGAEVRLAYVGRGGSLGPLDAAVDVRLPDGLGIAVASPIASGSGFFARVPGGYAGALALDVRGLALVALGAYHQPAPGRRDLIALIEGRFPPIPLGLGFSLVGAGGLLALGRGVDADRIRAGLRSGVVASTLFLDAGADLAGAIQSALELFPVRPGQLVLGPLVRIAWGTPEVAEVDLAVFVEAPAPTRLYLLAAARIGLPALAAPIVNLNFDALGVVDFDRGVLAIDASLHDSTLAGYALGGDLALRLGWGDAPEFLLSLGGFHPHFTPPPGFPALRRLSLVAGDNPQLRLAAYLAVTSNTVQVGARADLTAVGAGFEIKAHIGFDALFELVPFHFEAEISAAASIAWEGIHLASVDLDLTLSGPRPWHAKGDATFGVLWWDVSVGFDTTWGDATPAPLPPPPDIGAAVLAALGEPAAWTSELPAGQPAWITVGAASAPDGALAIHPFAAIVVRERVAPLEYPITQFGNIPLAAPQRFAIAGARVGTAVAGTAAVADAFAPGQFTRLSSDQRLAAPSFERFSSGVRIAADEVRLGATVRSTLETVTDVFDPLARPAAPPRIAPLPAAVATTTGIRRPTRPPARPPRRGPRLDDLRYVLASVDDLSITAVGATLAGTARTYAALREALRLHAAATGRRPWLQVVPRVEVANAYARVVVVREDDNLRNVDFVDTVTGRPMTRTEFVDAIHAGEYPGYAVRTMHGVATPVSLPNATTADNLG